ncbi:hypothetical protein EVAR_57086_1 [Eumeta japonica]|uniref:Uncharacterized protein n=1 Tax=Eumeta variegata TaxID=151549 RepID=A0A4C1Z508_EUMVA|nr:hypothetical protein EVAR_57086_1 [Eumeta japonica]
MRLYDVVYTLCTPCENFHWPTFTAALRYTEALMKSDNGKGQGDATTRDEAPRGRRRCAAGAGDRLPTTRGLTAQTIGIRDRLKSRAIGSVRREVSMLSRRAVGAGIVRADATGRRRTGAGATKARRRRPAAGRASALAGSTGDDCHLCLLKTVRLTECCEIVYRIRNLMFLSWMNF